MGCFEAPKLGSMKTNTLMIDSTPGAAAPVRKKKKQRDLSKAEMLRPADVYALYGIPSSTLCQMCKHPDPEKRMPSMLIPGRFGRKGLRLIDHAKLRAWLGNFDTQRGPVVVEGGDASQAA